jgi:membrane-associated phospholipid phosphatase
VIRTLANLVSIVVHPLLMPTIVFWLIFTFAPVAAAPFSSAQGWYIVGLIFVLTFVFPLIYVLVLKLTSFVSSVSMEDRKERTIPFLFISAFYVALSFILIPKLELNPTFPVIIIAISSLVAVLTVITLFWKISIHSAASCGLVGFILGIHFHFPENELLWPLVISVLIAGAVMSSRLYLGVHRMREIVAGAAVGMATSLGATLFLP